MSRFRVVYSRGSFGFVSLCDTHDAAIAEARALYGISGVWHVHVEDAAGTKVACDYDLAGYACRRSVSTPLPSAI